MPPTAALSVRLARARRARAGFSFIEILVVMAIIAVLVGIGIGIYVIVMKKTPQIKTQNLLQKIRANIDHFNGKFKSKPPSDFSQMSNIFIGAKLGRATPANTTNAGIEALYQAMVAPGFGHPADIDNDKCNTDEDSLDKAFDPSGDVVLYEIKDAWGNPLVYFTDGDYANAEKQPPTYIDAEGNAFNPKPWRLAPEKGGGFAQPNGFQVFSLGPDKLPNTDDDLKSWE
jgi:prepilin-type N-terminal cleavage/methylation domain-containing protein